MPSEEPTMMTGMMASPSSPSVKFTALLEPTMTQKLSATKPSTPAG